MGGWSQRASSLTIFLFLWKRNRINGHGGALTKEALCECPCGDIFRSLGFSELPHQVLIPWEWGLRGLLWMNSRAESSGLAVFEITNVLPLTCITCWFCRTSFLWASARGFVAGSLAAAFVPHDWGKFSSVDLRWWPRTFPSFLGHLHVSFFLS